MTKQILRFDIETAPETNDFWAYNKKHLREKKMLKEPDVQDIEGSYKERSTIYPEFSKVVCISFEIDGEKKSIIGEDEELLLIEFNNVIGFHHKAVLGGFNIIGFDIPFLRKRMIINWIKPHEKLCIGKQKPWEVDAVDVFLIWKQTSFGCSLDLLSTTLLGESPKSEMDGTMVGDLFYKKDFEAIKNYCEGDVEYTRRCYEAMANPSKEEKKAEEVEIIKSDRPEMTDEQLLKLQWETKYIRSFSSSEDLINNIRWKYKVSDAMRMKIWELRADEKVKADAWLPF